MATYIQQILDRADIQVLRDLLINAVADRSYVDSRTYEQRVQEGDASVNRYLERTYPDGAGRGICGDCRCHYGARERLFRGRHEMRGAAAVSAFV